MGPAWGRRLAEVVPRGRRFLPAWLGAGAALDFIGLRVSDLLLSGVIRTGLAPPQASARAANYAAAAIALKLVVIWIVHAAILPGWATAGLAAPEA